MKGLWVLSSQIIRRVHGYNISVLRIRICLDPFHFGQPDPDPVSKISANISQNHGKFRQ